MSRRTKTIVGVALAAAIIGAFGLWFAFLRDDAPEAASTEAAVAAARAGSSGSATIDSIEGMWTVRSDDPASVSYPFEESSYVGYRATEELGGVGANTAVGRTPEVDGSLAIEGTTVTITEITADMTALESDSAGRDTTLRTDALQTDQYPTAVFELTHPIDLGRLPAPNETIEASASGELTLHGTTQAITLPLEATLVGDQIVVVGRVDLKFEAYGIATPTAALVVSIDETAELEVQLFFVHES